MSQVVDAVEWRVLDNARNARLPSHGFAVAPPNLPATLNDLRVRGLIRPGLAGVHLLTQRGVAVHKANAGKYQPK